MDHISDIIKNKSLTADPHNKHEFQAYGNMLAEEFADPKHRTLYIKLAKTEKRYLLEQARAYVKDAPHASTPGKLFMWKLGELKKAQKSDGKFEQA